MKALFNFFGLQNKHPELDAAKTLSEYLRLKKSDSKLIKNMTRDLIESDQIQVFINVLGQDCDQLYTQKENMMSHINEKLPNLLDNINNLNTRISTIESLEEEIKKHTQSKTPIASETIETINAYIDDLPSAFLVNWECLHNLSDQTKPMHQKMKNDVLIAEKLLQDHAEIFSFDQKNTLKQIHNKIISYYYNADGNTENTPHDELLNAKNKLQHDIVSLTTPDGIVDHKKSLSSHMDTYNNQINGDMLLLQALAHKVLNKIAEHDEELKYIRDHAPAYNAMSEKKNVMLSRKKGIRRPKKAVFKKHKNTP